MSAYDKLMQINRDSMMTGVPSRAPVTEFSGPYSADDLTRDEFIAPIKDYMSDRFGVDELTGKSDEEIAQWYLNNMRGYNAGNSVRAFNELSYLNSADEKQLSRAGRAYEIFNNMEGVFSEETDRGEKFDAVKDYARTTLLDPINALSIGVGKAVGVAGSKGAATAARQAAIQAYKKAKSQGITRALSSGVGRQSVRETAEQLGKEAFEKSIRESAQLGMKNVAAQRTINTATKGKILSRLATKQGALEVASAVGVDSAIAAGADYAWQQGMIMTDNQEEYDKYQTGLTVLGSAILSGVIQTGSLGFRGTAGRVLPSEDIKIPQRSVQELSERFKTRLRDWKSTVEAGRSLDEISTEEVKDLILGGDGSGGLIADIVDNGWQDKWLRNESHENLTHFISRVFKEMDEEGATGWLSDFKSALNIEGDFTATQVGERIATKLSNAGRTMKVMSDAARTLGKRVEDITPNDLIKMRTMPVQGKAASWINERFTSQKVTNFQNNVIRSIVANVGTSQLNLFGWAASSALNTLTDASYALLNGPAYMTYKLLGQSGRAAEKARIVKSFTQYNRTKLAHLMDPQTSVERFRSFVSKHENLMSELANVKNGGIEAPNIDPSLTKLGEGFERYVDTMQTLNLVDAQDVFTKAVEFQSQLDKYLVRAYGKSSDELLSLPNASSIIKEKDYLESVYAAQYETLRSIYSKSMKGTDVLGEVASSIEDIRKIPGLGLLLPFGRFFNNTVAVAAEMSLPGVSNMGKAFLGKYTTRTHGELVTRSATMWGLALSMAPYEAEWFQQGLNWDEMRDPNTGAVQEWTWAYPAPLYKAAARIIAMKHIVGEDPSPELVSQIGKNLTGQLTRQLTDSIGTMGQLFGAVLTADYPEATRLAREAASGSVSQIVSGITRPLEPVNQAVGLAQGQDFFSPDRRVGTKVLNDSVRYIDNFMHAVGLLNDRPERVDAVEGPTRAQSDKFVSAGRENIAPTALEKAFNMAGITGFDTVGGVKPRSYTMFPEADNRYNKLFYDIVDTGARRLLERKEFREGRLRTDSRGRVDPATVRKSMLQNLVKDAREMTLAAMGNDLEGFIDRELISIYRSSKYSRKDINRAIKRVEETTGETVDVDNMTPRQLSYLKIYLDSYENILGTAN